MGHDSANGVDKKQMPTAFQEYLSCIVDYFGGQYDDRDHQKRETASLKSLCDKFNISIPKARKLLITAGVYSTQRSRQIAELLAQGKSITEIMTITKLGYTSVNSYLPYQKYSYQMENFSCYDLDSRKYCVRQKAVEQLHQEIIKGNSCHLEDILWQTVIAYQEYPFHTSSGLPFSYTVKQKKNGEYSGELLISRKEDSKTLTRSSVLLAFHKVLEAITILNIAENTNSSSKKMILPLFKGPKSIGQIFGISYIYSLFWKWGIIQVPEKVESHLRGQPQNHVSKSSKNAL